MTTNLIQEFKTPESYLEAMDVILTSRTIVSHSTGSPLKKSFPGVEALVSTPSTSVVEELLNKARSLLVENAATLLLRTLRCLRRNRDLPEFWSQHLIGSCEEANLWLNIFDIIIYSWTKSTSASSDKQAATSWNFTTTSITEDYLKNQYEKIISLRQQLKETEISQIEKELSTCQQKYSDLLLKCRPKHFYTFCSLKKAPHPLLQMVIELYLQILGVLPISMASNSFSDLKTAVATISLSHLSKFNDLDRLTSDNHLMAHIRKFLSKNHNSASSTKQMLLSPEDVEAAVNLKASVPVSLQWKNFQSTCVVILECILILEKINRLKLRSFVQYRPQEFRAFLHAQVERIVVRQLNVLLEYPQFSRLISSDYFGDIKTNRNKTICTESSEEGVAKSEDEVINCGNGHRRHRSATCDALLPEKKCFQVTMKRPVTVMWHQGKRCDNDPS